jgi:tungstate transport system ATP-binding protein
MKVIPMGLYYKVQLNCGFPLVAYVTTHSLENLSLTEGKEVFASFKATSIHVVRKKGRSEAF